MAEHWDAIAEHARAIAGAAGTAAERANTIAALIREYGDPPPPAYAAQNGPVGPMRDRHHRWG